MRWRARIAWLVGVLIAMVVVAIAAVQSHSVTVTLAVTAAVLLLFFVVAVLIATSKNAGITVYTNDSDIAAALAEHRTDASQIRAIWAARYGAREVRDYFASEAKDLTDNLTLDITRVLRPAVIAETERRALVKLKAEYSDRYHLHSDDARTELELFIADYPPELHRRSVGMIILVNANELRPELGILVNPNVDGRWSGVVTSMRAWFDAHAKARPEWDPAAVQRWNEIAATYDQYVTYNEHIAYLSTFVASEKRYVQRFIAEVAQRDHDIVVLEIGCATGRAIFGYLPPDFADSIALIIGIDHAGAMIAAAEEARREASRLRLASAVGRMFDRASFYELNAFMMSRYFLHGEVLSPEHLAELTTRPAYVVDHAAYAEATRILLCLLNTIGVMGGAAQRVAFVEEMLRAMSEGDHLLLTAFDAAYFDEAARELYTGLEGMIGSFGAEAFRSAEHTFEITSEPGYYSHWFERDELERVVQMAVSAVPATFVYETVDLDSGGWVVEISCTGA